MRNHSRAVQAVLAAVAALALAACAAPAGSADGTTSTPSPAVPSTAAAAAFPRTIEVPAGPAAAAVELVVPAEPQRIAALSYETAELVAELGLADRLVVVPAAVRNPALTNHLEELAAVPTTVPTESDTDPESIIALDPDLVLLSARHGLETGAGKVLADAGIPVLLLPNTWTDAEDMAQDVRLVGQAVGADEAAENLAERLVAGLEPRPVPSGAARRVLVLSNQAGRPFVTAGKAFPLELLRLAGGADVSAELGIAATGPIAAEQVVQAAPDGILLVDMNGSGEESFAQLLANPAVAQLSAVAQGRVTLVEGRQVQALGLDETIEGLAVLTAWVATL
jgi:iron complex transport system substrate-binding protein